MDRASRGCQMMMMLCFALFGALSTLCSAETLAPEITEPPEELYEVVDGAPITLTCRVFGAPQPDVTWLKNGVQLTSGHYAVQPNGDLYIENARFTDAGQYKCIARNKFGVVDSGDSLGHLKIREQTKFTARPMDYDVAAGKSATFRCSAVSDSSLELEILWLANGQPIDFESDPRMYLGTDLSLTISKTTKLDSGLYTCIARTKLDSVSASATLIVQDRPNRPNLLGVECKPKTAIVEWQPKGDSRPPILSYRIQYNTSFTPDKWHVAFDEIPASELKLEVSLSPWANYSFRVIAHNKIGKSKPSQPSSVCLTPRDVPYKNPEKVKGEGTKPNNIVFSWSMMPPIDHNGPGFFYRVFWKRSGTVMDWQTIDIPNWEQTHHVLWDQPIYHPFNIKVEAHNSVGQANVAAAEVIGYSGEDHPQVAPTNLILRNLIDANNALIQWDHVPTASVRGFFKGYKIQTWTTDEGPDRVRELTVSSDVNQTTVDVLVPFSENFVRVLVVNRQHEGPPSQVLRIRTPEGRPGPVNSFEVVPIGSSVFLLTWSPPEEPNGDIIRYDIAYAKVVGTLLEPEVNRDPVTDPHATKARLAALERNTKYRVTIRAATRVGPGSPFFIEEITGDGIPKHPSKPSFRWSRLGAIDGRASLLVTWNPSSHGHAGSHFFVQYKRKDETHWMHTKDMLNDDSMSVTGLEPGTVYELKVVSVDGDLMESSDVEEIEMIGGMDKDAFSWSVVAQLLPLGPLSFVALWL